MIPFEAVAMVLCAAAAVLVAFTKCPCVGLSDEAPAFDPAEPQAR